MKRIKYTGLYILIIVSCFVSGCYKDDGNYDYENLNKVTLSDAASAARIELKLNDKLTLMPAIVQSVARDTTNLEYHWSYYEERSDGGPSPYIKLPDTRKLELTIQPPFILGRNYRVISEVKDKNTGVTSYLYYPISIVNEFSQGWIFMEDKANNTELSLILPDGRVIFGQSKPAIGKPVKLEITPRSISDDLSPAGRRIYAIGESDGMELDYQTLIKKLGYSDLFYEAPPSPVKLQYINWPSSIGIAINNGIVHSNLTGGFPGAKRWGSPLLSTKGSFNYSVSTYVAGGIVVINGTGSFPSVVYDNTNKCFAYVASAIGGAGAALTAFPTTASNTAIFDMNNVGMTMVYMDSANIVSEFNAVMKDATNIPYLLRFKTVYPNASPTITLAKYQMNAPDIINLSAAAGSTTTPHLFYAVGNKLYRHETSSNTTTQPFSFAAGENVTKMDYQQSAAGILTPRLVVSTWNGTEGKVYYFALSSVGDFSTYSNVFTGFGRIVDMAYKVPGN